MKKIASKIITYTALNLVISSPFTTLAFAEQVKNVTLTTKVKPVPAKTAPAKAAVAASIDTKAVDKKVALTSKNF